MLGALWFLIYCNYALAFWQGSRFLVHNDISVGAIVAVLMSMMMGAFSLGNIAPNLDPVVSGIAAAAKIFATIDRVPVIDSESTEGVVLDHVQGDIKLDNIKFIYPSRPNVVVMEDMSLSVGAGQTVALVGASGSGKSTIIGLLERFYEPVAGKIYLDGHDISTLNTKWLRQQIALVSQEPTLFACTIFENITYGLIGTQYEHASDDERMKRVVEACHMANAYQFIQDLPEKFETHVGERGFLLSGGQKQRIAIARAIVANPRILLLDEATSALDTKSEGIVQDALEKASKDRTTIVIAHRLSTIKDADQIVVMAKGKIVEQGTHNELLDRHGMYYELVDAQRIHKADGSIDPEAANEKLVVREDDMVAIGPSDTNVSANSLIARQVADDNRQYSLLTLIKLLYSLNKPERTLIFFSICFAFVAGAAYPVQSVLFAKCVTAFEVLPSQYGHMREQINLFAGLFFMLAGVEGVAYVLMMGMFAFTAQRLVRRIRLESFRSMLRQDIAYFDKDGNSTGSLTSQLSQEAQSVEGLSGATLGHILNSSVTIIVGIILSLSVAWKLALVCAACMPLVVGAGYLRFALLARFEKHAQKAYDKSASYACEATTAIRTVASLTREQDVLDNYNKAIAAQLRDSRVETFRSSLLYAIAQGLVLFVMALGFWFGAGQLKTHSISTTAFFISFIATVFGSQSAGIVFSFAPNMGKARQATNNIKRLFDRRPVVDAWSTEGKVPTDISGAIEFRNVHFRYPTRMEVPVLRGLNLDIKPGQFVALVGSSGCGKSTTIGLIESFYLPLAGEVLLDGVNIREFNVNAYRSHIALVQQEPVLYAGTIRDNVRLGSLDDVTDDQVFEACRQANIHDFIMSLPDGYDTLCGTKGTLLSGGQKQRIAIARALIRQPKILLLDEATSALDSESEKVVQAALDKAAEGRTTIAVAHRLSTIQNADVIYVFENGVVLESGTHQQLLANQSKYYELVQLQALERN
ncbi:P-loop containing nucleoside triphosphate hydrolase protein [Dipodascopsis tothii]|uniref:P-loop containing nucleoside triphosphate hydrolase protein n=1 Tax=Dipodascopsis tothii TaxID=44089 RepID=UPI0034D00C4B